MGVLGEVFRKTHIALKIRSKSSSVNIGNKCFGFLSDITLLKTEKSLTLCVTRQLREFHAE